MEAETLLNVLTSTVPGDSVLVTDPRFHRADLLELMLLRAGDAQSCSPEEAARLAGLAIEIAERLHDDPETAHSTFVRACCLTANSFRLAGQLGLANDALRKCVSALDPLPGRDEYLRALFCRALALVRWEQGRLDEALTLLRQAWRLFGGDRSEQITCSLLLCLLHDEMGLPEKVFASVSPHLGEWFEPSCRPWLTSRAMLTFAAATPETRLIALIAVEQGVRFQGFVADTQEQLRLFALEGKARARLGFFDEAEQMIDAVRRQHLADRRLFELTLSSLDLLAQRIAAGERTGVAALSADIESLHDLPSARADLALVAIDRFAFSLTRPACPWTSQRSAATWYIQAHRLQGPPPPPLPFA